MKLDLKLQNYVAWKVKNVMKIKEGYGYRVILTYADGSEVVQQKGGFETKRAADDARNITIGQLSINGYVVYENLDLKSFFEFWLETEIHPYKAHSTYDKYKRTVWKKILPDLGNKKISKVSKGDIQELYNHMLEISRNTAMDVKIVVRQAFRYALEKKMISNDPTKDVKLPKQNKKKGEYRVRHIDVRKTLTYEEVLILIEAAKGTKIYLQVLFAVLMGLRCSEIIAVKYSDIDYVNRTLRVERQLGVIPMSKKEDFAPKTYRKQEIKVKTESSVREVPIPDILFEAILQEREVYEKNKRRRLHDQNNPFLDEKYICCSTYGKPRSKDYHWPHFKKLLKENNLPDIRWHDLRATYCTILLKNNFNEKAVAKMMGHAKEIVTIDVYADKNQLVCDCLEVLEPFIEEVLPQEPKKAACELICLDGVVAELLDCAVS